MRVLKCQSINQPLKRVGGRVWFQARIKIYFIIRVNSFIAWEARYSTSCADLDSINSINSSLQSKLIVTVPEGVRGIQPGRGIIYWRLWQGGSYSPITLILLLNTCLSGQAKSSCVFFFFAPLWLHLYSNYSDCCKLEWVFKHFSWIILNTLNVPVGFASLKSFSLSRGPVFPPPLGGSVCVGTLRRGGKDLLPCWPCTAPCSRVSPELCPAPISPRGLRAAGIPAHVVSRDCEISCCAQQWGWSRVFQHMHKLLVNLRELDPLFHQNVIRIQRVVVAALRHYFLSNTEKACFPG